MPSYTFVSTANPFVLRGAKPVFCDIRSDNLNLDETKLVSLINEKTKAIVPVHYAGVSCEMDEILKIARDNNLYVIEDAAQGVNAKYKEKYLGTLGHFGCYSFHGTKNYCMGEGGALLINKNIDLFERAEIIREKGTNRKQFFRGQVDKYTWVDIGSSYLPSDILASILWNQFEYLDEIQNKRKSVCEKYAVELKPLQEKQLLRLPIVNDYAESNYHMFYVILNSENERSSLIKYLKNQGIQSVFHYIPLHQSLYYKKTFGVVDLPNTDYLSERLLRLPLFYSITDDEVNYVIDKIKEWAKLNYSFN